MLSIGISLLILSLIFKSVYQGGKTLSPAILLNFLQNISVPFIALYFASTLLQAVFRALRYQRLLKAGGEKNIPDFFYIYWITLVRNMTVDLLPARAGELSYIMMLNIAYKVSPEACFSSLGLSIIFDFIALFFLILGVFIINLLSLEFHPWIVISLILIGIVIIVSLYILLTGINRIVALLNKYFPRAQTKTVERLKTFFLAFNSNIQNVKQSKKLGTILSLSFCVRLFKYMGGYFLFLALTKYNFEHFTNTPFWKVFYALLGAEGAASLPIPSFMSFGLFESGGVLTLTWLGFAAKTAALLMLGMHLLSQIIDYTLGGIALTVFFFSYKTEKKAQTVTKQKRLIFAGICSLLLIGFSLSAIQYKKIKKLGSLKSPNKGKPVHINHTNKNKLHKTSKNLSGFIVWSSNRFGNHDILMITFPDLLLHQLTDHSHTETYPRISPDGKKVVFCRSKLPWVSQRDPIPWEIHMLDIETKKTRLISDNGNTPTWSLDGKKIYFQRNADSFIEHNLETSNEKIICKSGKDNLPVNTVLETPHYNSASKKLAVTLRGSRRTMGIYSTEGFVSICDGCQLTWSPDLRFLYYTYYGGKQRNAFYRYFPLKNESIKWFDSPNDFSHEYFPKLSPNQKYLVYGASTGDHEHDTADYEIFLWKTDTSFSEAVRITYHTGNDCWPDIYLKD